MNNTEMNGTIIVPSEGDAYAGSTELLREYILTINVNGELWKTVVCTAMMLRELVTGRLLSEGCIRSVQDIISMEIDEEKGTACVRVARKDPTSTPADDEPTGNEPADDEPAGNTDSIPADEAADTAVGPARVFSLIKRFASDDTLHRRTSGTHSVLLDCGGQTAFVAEDINRHNALDKAIGAMMLQGLEPADCMIFTSGRVAFDTIRKIVAAKVPVLISKAVPTADAVRLARENGIVLIGRAWPDRYEIYTTKCVG